MHRTGNHAKGSVWAHVPILTPERKLWRAVLMQAYSDAEIAVGDVAEDFEPVEQVRARSYLRADTAFDATNLKLVCEFADLPADRIYLWARKQFTLEQSSERHLECMSPAAAVYVEPLGQSKEPEPGSCTPQIAA